MTRREINPLICLSVEGRFVEIWHVLFFFKIHTKLNVLTGTFLLVICSDTFENLLRFVYGQTKSANKNSWRKKFVSRGFIIIAFY